MALDKQRILSELGSVVNQLQSADCGCMSKLFYNSGQNMGMPLPTCGGCRRECCHNHGYSNHGCGISNTSQPYSPMSAQCMNRPYMGSCNPPKLYADTYNYLNKNLMQPVVKEVYEDLKCITPANTIMNNPVASQICRSGGNTRTLDQDNIGIMNNTSTVGEQNGLRGNPGSSMPLNNTNTFPQIGQTNQRVGYMNQLGQPNQTMGHMDQGMAGGMGAQIVNMMMGDSIKPSNTPAQGGQLTEPMIIEAPQSPHGKIGVSPLIQGTYNLSGTSKMNNNQENYLNQGQQNHTPNNIPQNSVNSNIQQTGAMKNPAVQQMANAHHAYGNHTQGMTKFNEMFPGVMQGGDLGFDPMAIAIQMNPANHQKAAMNTIHKLMTGHEIDRVLDTPVNSTMKSVIKTANAASASVNETNNIVNNQSQQNNTNGNPNENKAMLCQQVTPPANHTPIQSQSRHEPVRQPNTGVFGNQVHQQQVYTTVTGAPTLNQPMPSEQAPQQYQQTAEYQKQQQHHQQQQESQYQELKQQIIDPSTGAVFETSKLPEGTFKPDDQIQHMPLQAEQYQSPAQSVIKEPIFPADTLRNQMPPNMKSQKCYQYNTLGQPVEMLPAKLYHPPEPQLPQTLSPQSMPSKLKSNPIRYSNVKNTVSKTSIMGNKTVRGVPSRNQLQHIYNQYKGSHSFTQQNVRPPAQNTTFSEGKLNVQATENPSLRSQQGPIEKVGGDTQLINVGMKNHLTNKLDLVKGEIGDMLNTNMPIKDEIPDKLPPAKQSKFRNGLQDMVYTSYPSTTAWSFHGYNRIPFSSSYRFRNRA